MFQMITIIIAVVSVILSFVLHPIWGWIPIAIVDLIIGIQLWAAKQKYRFNYIHDLSSEANELLQRYGHYFAMPFASRDFSASAATSQFAGIAIAIIDVFNTLWWGIALAAGNWFLMGFVAVSFSPVSLLEKSPALQMAHDEIVEYITSHGNQK